MSGITGWLSHERDLTPERNVIADMAGALYHRGPDEGGTWVQHQVGLGHRLLVTGQGTIQSQPVTITTSGGQLAIVLDGQIYNRGELLRQLGHEAPGHLSGSDAETVLRGYIAWGPQVAERLNGIYAFAIWDPRSSKLILGRDRLGLKPLYFYPLRDGVLFGSEPKAIFQHADARKVVEASGMCEIYSGFNRTPGNAIWAGMYEVPPATWIAFSPAGRQDQTYWRLTAEPHFDDQRTTIATARRLLSDCVREQLPDEDPYCILLSGGLDSSVIAGMTGEHARAQGRKVQTFTLDFAEQDKYFKADLVPARPDTPFARDVADYIGAEHAEIIFDCETMADPALRRTCVAARDLPVGFGDRDMSFFLMCSAMREHARVAMTGDGGGQTFGPYPTRRDHEQATSNPWRPRRIPLADDALVDKAFLDAIGRDDYVREGTAAAMREAPVLEDDSETDRRVRASFYLSMTRMPHWATTERRDRISARAGLEIRTPYFDHGLIQYLFNAPWPLKAFDGKEKSLLRAVGDRVVPPSVKARRKKGYPGILHVRYTAALQQQVSDLVSTDHAVLQFYDSQKVKAAVISAPEVLSPAQQFGMERLLDLATWADLTGPTFRLP